MGMGKGNEENGGDWTQGKRNEHAAILRFQNEIY